MKLGALLTAELVQLHAAKDKVTKVGAGYVFRANTDYRCKDCWKWIPSTHQCGDMRTQDIARKNGTCIMWAEGATVPGLKPSGAYTPKEVGYTEEPTGTKCKRCMFFDTTAKKYCQRVDEKSPGDTPGRIDPDACCANQTPRRST